MEKQRELLQHIAHRADREGIVPTAIPQLSLIRSNAVTEPLHTLYDPSYCLVVSGRKRARIGDRDVIYAAGDGLAVGMDLPVIGAVIEASQDVPYLSLKFDLDRTVLADLLLSLPRTAAPEPPPRFAASVQTATPEVLDACVRLLRLLDHPEDIAVMAPLIEREILYRLLTGPQSAVLRQIATGESHLGRIGRAVDHLRRNYAEPTTIEDLAGIAGMSASTFHDHFRAATAMSPLQFRTRIRMQEARRLMVAEGLTAAEAGFRVGYESPSQFSRDHVRLYDRPPRRDLERMRAEVAPAAPQA